MLTSADSTSPVAQTTVWAWLIACALTFLTPLRASARDDLLFAVFTLAFCLDQAVLPISVDMARLSVCVSYEVLPLYGELVQTVAILVLSSASRFSLWCVAYVSVLAIGCVGSYFGAIIVSLETANEWRQAHVNRELMHLVVRALWQKLRRLASRSSSATPSSSVLEPDSDASSVSSSLASWEKLPDFDFSALPADQTYAPPRPRRKLPFRKLVAERWGYVKKLRATKAWKAEIEPSWTMVPFQQAIGLRRQRYGHFLRGVFYVVHGPQAPAIVPEGSMTLEEVYDLLGTPEEERVWERSMGWGRNWFPV